MRFTPCFPLRLTTSHQGSENSTLGFRAPNPIGCKCVSVFPGRLLPSVFLSGTPSRWLCWDSQFVGEVPFAFPQPPKNPKPPRAWRLFRTEAPLRNSGPGLIQGITMASCSVIVVLRAAAFAMGRPTMFSCFFDKFGSSTGETGGITRGSHDLYRSFAWGPIQDSGFGSRVEFADGVGLRAFGDALGAGGWRRSNPQFHENLTSEFRNSDLIVTWV